MLNTTAYKILTISVKNNVLQRNWIIGVTPSAYKLICSELALCHTFPLLLQGVYFEKMNESKWREQFQIETNKQ